MKMFKILVTIAGAMMLNVMAGETIPEFVPERDFVPGIIQPSGLPTPEQFIDTKTRLEHLRNYLESSSASPTEKVAAISQTINYVQGGTQDILRRAEQNLDEAPQIIQAEIDRLNNPGQNPQQPLLGAGAVEILQQGRAGYR